MASFFSEQTKQVSDYFEKWHTEFKYSSKNGDMRSRYCQLYDVFEDRERREPFNENNKKYNSPLYHNCIGCNLEEGCLNILDFTQRFSGGENARTYLTIYSLLFYTLAERMGVIYEELGIITDKNKFDWTKFPVLRQIKHWANFFKHPKSYMFLHHPDYFLENDPKRPNFLIEGEINSDFVNRYYKANANNEQLRSVLTNKKDWKIIFPDIVKFTKNLCYEIDNFCEYVIRPENVEVLRSFTFRDY